MEFSLELNKIIKKIKHFEPSVENTLPNNCYFLDDYILLKTNRSGDARYPYVKDGRALWVHQNGNISFNESNYFIIREALEGESNFLGFFLGIEQKNNYLPISLFELNKNIFEQNVNRYTLFKESHAIFILEYKKIYYALRITVSENKELAYELIIKNNSLKSLNLYSSMFLNFNMMHGNANSVETKWFKKCSYFDNRFLLETVEDISRYEHINNELNLFRCLSDDAEILNTTSRGVYCNSKTNNFENSECLLEGSFFKDKHVTNFSDLAICGDIIKFTLPAKKEFKISYLLKEKNVRPTQEEISLIFEKTLQNSTKYLKNKDFLNMKFRGENEVNDVLFTKFIKEVIKQVDYCARTKNSTLVMLGIRDIFQAIEAGLIWNKKDAKRKIIEALNYVSLEGRLPRQYSLPFNNQNFAYVDDRLFIDQGLWVIDCLYQYLAYTNDSSILKELCDYVEFDNKGKVTFLNKKDSLLHHLYKITQFLIDNINENTHCLMTLFGDWNDAVDGLGKSQHYEGYGNGVSAMATFQLYNDLHKMIEIINKYDKNNHQLLELYNNKIEELKKGINEKLFHELNGDYKIIHGWGNNEEFFVGSFKDVDNKERDSLTSNAFYILSNFYKENDKYIPYVLNAYNRLDSKYGFKTFTPFFDKDAGEVGRIINLPKGTAENAATYIHGTVFALNSLFMINKAEEAFKQIYKILPITHEFISTSPFIMPNSYIHNEDIEVDGESMNDWFTGSSSTLIKALITNAFGINVGLDKLIIQTANYFPYNEASISIKVCNSLITLVHINTIDKIKRFIVNDEEIKDIKNDGYRNYIELDKAHLPNKLNIVVYN